MSDDGWMRVLYLSLLGVVLLWWLFGMYRGRLGQAMQNAAIWVLIFLGAILAYGFKEQIAFHLSPGSAMRSGEGVAIARSADGHFHATLEVEGTPVEFLVDTGASEIVLSPADARRIGFDLEALSYTARAMTANGIVRAAPVRLGEIRFAGAVDRNVPALVNGAEMAGSLLGMGYLDRFARVEIRGDRLTLER